MTISSGMFQHDNARPHVACVSQESAAPQHPDISLACPFAWWNICVMHGISVYTRAIHHHKLIQNFLLRYCMSSRTFYNIWLRLCIAVVKVSSGLMVITDVDILPTPVAHVCMCTCFRCIPRDTVLETYRAIHFSWHLDLWLLVSCLPVLLLNFENWCHFHFF